MTEAIYKESIYASEKIVLFGREVDDLAVLADDSTDAALKKADKQLARIYGFTYDGAYIEFGTPVLFLVGNDSKDANKERLPGPNPRDKEFFDSLKAWTVDKDVKTVRLDVDVGKFEDVLLAAAADGLEAAGRVAGAKVSGAKVSGAKVSGAKVSGAKMSGTRISGARD
ncbi:hypothetical protein [uncultured Roseobacter sp.]|uniref:hypothetical protein n=1 Tax=uncultured Roseobacter sp. TaxID=114847 RepID=UPI0026118A51|nr:hypothetical protein [uncultured Roseobacter sp.]